MFNCFLFLLLLARCSDDKSEPAPDPEYATSAWNAGYMDLAVAPGEDFYRYALGGWMAANPKASQESISVKELSRVKDEVVSDLIAGNEVMGREYALLSDAGAQEAGVTDVMERVSYLRSAGTREELVGRAIELGQEGYLLLWKTSLDVMDKRGIVVLEQDMVLREAMDEETGTVYRETMTRVLEALGLEAGVAARMAANALEGENLIREHADPLLLEEYGFYKVYVTGLDVLEDIWVASDLFGGLNFVFNEAPEAVLQDYLAWSLVRVNMLSLPGKVRELLVGSGLLAGSELLAGTDKDVARQAVAILHEREVVHGVCDRLTRPGLLDVYERLVKEIMVEMRKRIETATWIQDASTRKEALLKLDRMRVFMMGQEVATRGANDWISAASYLAMTRVAVRETVMARRGMYVAVTDTENTGTS